MSRLTTRGAGHQREGASAGMGEVGTQPAGKAFERLVEQMRAEDRG